MSPHRRYVPASEFADVCQWSRTTTPGESVDNLIAQAMRNEQTQQHSFGQQLDTSDIASAEASETQEQPTSRHTSQTLEGQTSEEQYELTPADGSEDKEEANASRV